VTRMNLAATCAVLALSATTISTLGPDRRQQALISRGYGMFVHFGINTFNETEWSDGTLPVASYRPTRLDCEQWVETAKRAGFRYIVLVTKHHDGFCLWNSALTDYDVGSSSVPTDVVAEVARACRRLGLGLGLYYSLWDRHEPTHQLKDPAAYVEFMKGQLTELLTRYGPIAELWFDGGWAKPDADWNLPAVHALVTRLQPDCLIGVNHTISIPGKPRAIRQPKDYVAGDPIRFWPSDFRLKDPNLVRWDDPKIYTAPDGRQVYLPFEHTICLSNHWNWFQKREEKPVRALDELEELFYWGTANDNVLIVNVPPDQTGRIRPHERDQVIALADRLGIGGGRPLPAGPVNQAFTARAEADSSSDDASGPLNAVDYSLDSFWRAKTEHASLTIAPAAGGVFEFDRVALHERGESREGGDGFTTFHDYRVRAFAIDALRNGAWQEVHAGAVIGAARIVTFPRRIVAEKIRVRVTDASAPAGLRHVSISRRDSIRPRRTGPSPPQR